MKKIWFIPIGIVLVSVIIGGVIVVRNNQSNQAPDISVENQENTPTPTPTPWPVVTWKDEAGFSFDYPKELSTNKHEEDNDSYAHVELTHKDHPGGGIVWVKDLPRGVTTVESWAKQKIFSGATVLDTTLDGRAAKKILLTAEPKKMLVGTVEDGLLFYVDMTLTDAEYWTRVSDVITGSFAFTWDEAPKAASGGVSGGAGAGEDIDEEEVVQ